MRHACHIATVLMVSGALSGCLAHHAGSLPQEPTDATFAEVRGARIHYLDEGQGPAVVLIHGFAASMGTWADVLPELTGQHRVLALDLKGFGWSDRTSGDYSPFEQARIVLDLMEARGIERAAVVGHSYGASVALAMALEAPQRVSRLALYDAWVFEDQLPTFFHLSRAEGVGEALFAAFYDQRPEDRMALAFHDPTRLEQDFVDHAVEMLDRPGTRAAALAAVRGMRFGQWEERYATVQQPALLLWGREDLVTPLRIGERLSHTLPHAELETYPRCGHFPMIEAFHRSTRRLVAFLAADLEPTGTSPAATPITATRTTAPPPSNVAPAPPLGEVVDDPAADSLGQERPLDGASGAGPSPTEARP